MFQNGFEQEITEETEIGVFCILSSLRFVQFKRIGIKALVMHALYPKASQLTESIIAAAIEVHKTLGSGLLESIYEWALIRELELKGRTCCSQKLVVIRYKEFTREEPLRFDVLIEGCVLVEAKAVDAVLPIHKATLLSYMRLLDMPIGLVINFHEMKLVNGLSHLILPGANQ